MNDDIRLQALFDSFQPTPTDSDLFTERLERKLALIDEIRQAQAARMVVAIAFVTGIVIGGGTLAFILNAPTDVPLFTFGINFYPLLLIEQNSRIISAFLSSLMITTCIIAMLNTDDMARRMRRKSI